MVVRSVRGRLHHSELAAEWLADVVLYIVCRYTNNAIVCSIPMLQTTLSVRFGSEERCSKGEICS